MTKVGVEQKEEDEEASGRKLFQPLWREDQNGSTPHLDQLLPFEASQHASDSLSRATDQVGQFLMRECHRKAHLRLAAGRCPPPIEQYSRKPACSRTGQRQAPRIEERSFVLR